MKAPPPPPETPPRDSLSVELGTWFKANATGALSVVVVGLILALLGVFGLAQVWLTLGPR